MIERERFEVSGVVQGVGFRPFVWRLARRLNLSGDVRNSADGVLIDVQGERRALDAFGAALTRQAPPLARIDAIRRTRGAPDARLCGFRIAESLEDTAGETTSQSRIPADSAPCDACLDELFSEENRRWRHPFICCTDCGPRFTLTWRTPYDRAHTSMAAFTPCARCAAEYADPAERRFHAQTLACPECGPVLRFERLDTNAHANAQADINANAAGKHGDGDGNANGNDKSGNANINADANGHAIVDSNNNDNARVNANNDDNDNASRNANVHASISGHEMSSADPVARAWNAIARGEIVAVQGLGGFQLICDATQPAAIERLRERKRRPAKPLALLTLNVASAMQWVEGLEQTEENGETQSAQYMSSGTPGAFSAAQTNGESNIEPGNAKKTGKTHPADASNAAALLASAARPVVVLKQRDGGRNDNIGIDVATRPDNLSSKVPDTASDIANNELNEVKEAEKNDSSNGASNTGTLPAASPCPVATLKQQDSEENGNINATTQSDNSPRKTPDVTPDAANSELNDVKESEKNRPCGALNVRALSASAARLIVTLKQRDSEENGNADATTQPDNLLNKASGTAPNVANSELNQTEEAEENSPANGSNITALPSSVARPVAAPIKQRSSEENGNIDVVAQSDNLSGKAHGAMLDTANSELNEKKKAGKNGPVNDTSNANALPASTTRSFVVPQRCNSDGNANCNSSNDNDGNDNTPRPTGKIPAIAPNVAPGLDRLGLMLPSTPIQYLLFHQALGQPRGTHWLREAQPVVLVATSANLSGEPLLADPADARRALAGIADALLWHNRKIVVRCDDSVILAAPPAASPATPADAAQFVVVAPAASPLASPMATTSADAVQRAAVTPAASSLAHPAAATPTDTALHTAVAPAASPLAAPTATRPADAVQRAAVTPAASSLTRPAAATPTDMALRAAAVPAAPPLASPTATASADTVQRAAVTLAASSLARLAAATPTDTALRAAVAPATPPLASPTATASADTVQRAAVTPAAASLARSAATAEAEPYAAVAPATPPCTPLLTPEPASLTIMLRRARGYVPQPLPLPLPASNEQTPCVLALGAQMKSTVTLARGRFADVSPYLGDLRSASVCELLEETAERHVRRSHATPDAIACDRQPDLYSTRLAEALAERWRVPLLRIQHHHAHLAAVLAENGHAGPALGLALDGFGWGDDGTAWGGELLRIESAHKGAHDGAQARRLGHLSPLPLPGADAAARAPWRMALALLHVLEPGARRVPPAPGALTGEMASMAGMTDKTGMISMAEMAARLYPQIERGFNCPATTSLGRWFDAIAGLAGICAVQRYEGEAAMKLEARARPVAPYANGWRIDERLNLDLLPLARTLVALRDPVEIASRWHATLAAALADWLRHAMRATGLRTLALAGGCCANLTLMSGVRNHLQNELRAARCTLLHARHLPPGDDAISYGQTWAAIGLLGHSPGDSA